MWFRFGSGLFISTEKSEDWMATWWKFPERYINDVSVVISLCPFIGTVIVSALERFPVSIPVHSSTISFADKSPFLSCSIAMQTQLNTKLLSSVNFRAIICFLWESHSITCFPHGRRSLYFTAVNTLRSHHWRWISHFFSVKAPKLLYFKSDSFLDHPSSVCSRCFYSKPSYDAEILCTVFSQTRKSSDSRYVVARGMQLVVNSAHLYLSTHRFRGGRLPLINAARTRNASAIWRKLKLSVNWT